MRFRSHLLIVLSLALFALGGCGGSGGAGLNGGITVTATSTGSVVTATATYTNPQKTDLIGTPIDFSVQIGSQLHTFATVYTNNSGSVSLAFTPLAFNGTQTITVFGSIGNLSNFDTVVMNGRTLIVTPPTSVTLTTALAGGSSVPFTIPSSAGFIAITDPFSNDLAGHTISIAASFVSSNSSDSLTSPSLTTTNSGGTAIFPGANGTLIVPAAVGGVETMTITWTVTDQTTGQIGTGVTTVTLTKTS